MHCKEHTLHRCLVQGSADVAKAWMVSLGVKVRRARPFAVNQHPFSPRSAKPKIHLNGYSGRQLYCLDTRLRAKDLSIMASRSRPGSPRPVSTCPDRREAHLRALLVSGAII